MTTGPTSSKTLTRATRTVALLGATALLGGPAPLQAQEPSSYHLTAEDFEEEAPYSPYVDRSYPDQVLFGDTHFHTKLSFDAGLVGTTLDIEEGVRFARGETVRSNTGQQVQLIRPLDFLAITDHAEFLGIANMLRDSDPNLLSDPWGKSIYDMFNGGAEGRANAFRDIITRSITGVNPLSTDTGTRNIWTQAVAEIDAFNDPGAFTTMIGWEWTSTPDGDNLHRVVLLGDGADKASMITPYSMFDSTDPEDLWSFLEGYESQTGGRAISVPHNGNLSNGIMFALTRRNGEPIDRAYAEARARWEPTYEVTQMKGDEEAHPLISTEDEFADFENWDVSNIAGSRAKTPDMLPGEYARYGLMRGLQVQQEVGANPFKFGLAASTDTHTALATTRESNYFGKYQKTEPSLDRHNDDVIPSNDPSLRIITAQESASGLTAVWARENTRSEIFSAMQRREVYATTGTRLRVRVFGGFEFGADDLATPDFAAQGYGRGVPMGGDLTAAPEGTAPGFLIRALRDPDGANLDRVQVIKGWVDADGETHERIYDVAVSDGRTIDADGRCRTPVGNTVDVPTATFANSIGDAALEAYWSDPDFDASQPAFYYVRVLEIPTPRWTTYDHARLGVPLPDVVPATIQDRAYTSPIWYTPAE